MGYLHPLLASIAIKLTMKLHNPGVLGSKSQNVHSGTIILIRDIYIYSNIQSINNTLSSYLKIFNSKTIVLP